MQNHSAVLRRFTPWGFYVGTRLLATALRDPAPLIDIRTFLAFTQWVEACVSVLEQGPSGEIPQRLQVALQQINASTSEVIQIGPHHVRLGHQTVEAMAAHVDQVQLLLESAIFELPASLHAHFAQVMQAVIEDLRTAPGGVSRTVSDPLLAYLQGHEISVEETR